MLILSKRVVQNVSGVVIKDCESVVHCTQTPHINVLAGGDEFSAAFESRVAHFELYDGLRVFLTVIGNEESISEPQEFNGQFQLDCSRVPSAGRRAVDARAQTGPYTGRTLRRACRCRASRRTSGTFRARGCGGRAQCAGRSPHGTASYTYVVPANSLPPMSTRESFSAQLIHPIPSVCIAPLAAVAAQCHQPVGELLVRPVFARTQEQCVRVAKVAHTQHTWVRVVWGSVHVAQVAGVVAHSHRAHHFVG